jgi:hypothetical protein
MSYKSESRNNYYVYMVFGLIFLFNAVNYIVRDYNDLSIKTIAFSAVNLICGLAILYINYRRLSKG